MTGSPDTPGTPATPTAGSSSGDDQEAAEIAAYLAAEGVANDYHPDDLPPDRVAG